MKVKGLFTAVKSLSTMSALRTELFSLGIRHPYQLSHLTHSLQVLGGKKKKKKPYPHFRHVETASLELGSSCQSFQTS